MASPRSSTRRGANGYMTAHTIASIGPMGTNPNSTIIRRHGRLDSRRAANWLFVGVLVLCPLGAKAASGPGVETLTKGHSYAVPAVMFCTSQDALRTLVNLRNANDLDTLPSGCFRPSAAKFEGEFKSFIPDHKISGIAVREKLATLNRYGTSTCIDPDTGAAIHCTMRIIKSGFIAGIFVGTDSSRTKAFIEVGCGVEVIDPRSGELQFAPLQ
jgi:hypothetical protein